MKKPALEHLPGVGWVIALGEVDEAEARDRAQLAALPNSVMRALLSGQQHLQRGPGHYIVRVDGGPDVDPIVDYAAGGKYKPEKTAAR